MVLRRVEAREPLPHVNRNVCPPDTWTRMSLTALLVTAKHRRHAKQPSVSFWVNKLNNALEWYWLYRQ